MPNKKIKPLGFGFMRLPVTDGKNKIDFQKVSQLVDAFLKNGFSYFDTAWPYHNGLSEVAIKTCLTDRYNRDKFLLADKIAPCFAENRHDLEVLFRKQLIKCGVDYFDVYLLHNLGGSFYRLAENQDAFSFLKEKKEKGYAKKIGFSYHDTPELLERILEKHTEIDVVQLQINYLDWDNPAIQSGVCYQVARKYHKEIIVMEPIKGGGLAHLPLEAKNVFDHIGNYSPASYALRFAANLPGVRMVLSGMNSIEQVYDNMATMEKLVPLTKKEFAAIDKVKEILKSHTTIPCTACGYCISGCPQHIAIPMLFSIYNQKLLFGDNNFPEMHYSRNTKERECGTASDCIGCGKCEFVCPQHLKIRNFLKLIAGVFG